MTKRPSLIINLAGQHCQHELEDLVEDAINYDLDEVIGGEIPAEFLAMGPQATYDMLVNAARTAHNEVVELWLYGPRK